MPLDQGQGALADRAEADHHDGAIDAGVYGPIGHCAQTPTDRNDGASSKAMDDGEIKRRVISVLACPPASDRLLPCWQRRIRELRRRWRERVPSAPRRH